MSVGIATPGTSERSAAKSKGAAGTARTATRARTAEEPRQRGFADRPGGCRADRRPRALRRGRGQPRRGNPEGRWAGREPRRGHRRGRSRPGEPRRRRCAGPVGPAKLRGCGRDRAAKGRGSGSGWLRCGCPSHGQGRDAGHHRHPAERRRPVWPLPSRSVTRRAGHRRPCVVRVGFDRLLSTQSGHH